MRDGWNLTGDTLCASAAAASSFVARSDDMIVSSGYKHSPRQKSRRQLMTAIPAVASAG